MLNTMFDTSKHSFEWIMDSIPQRARIVNQKSIAHAFFDALGLKNKIMLDKRDSCRYNRKVIFEVGGGIRTL